MPTAINFNGTTTRRPGVYAEVDVSNLSGRTLDLNRVAIVGSFPMLKQATPKEFQDATVMAGFDTSEDNVATIAKLLYRGSNDSRVAGGPSATILVSVNETAQAQAVLLTSGKSQLTLKSNLWGPSGNRTDVSYSASTNKLTISRDGVVEGFEDLEDTGYLKLYYGGTAANATTLTAGPETGVLIKSTWLFDTSGFVEDADPNTATTPEATLNELQFDGTIKFTLVNAAGDADALSNNVVMTVIGTNKATGAALTEPVTITNGTTVSTSNGAFSAVTSIVLTYKDKDDGSALAVALGNDVKVEMDAYNLDPSSYPKLQGIFDRINTNQTTHKYVVTSDNPKLGAASTNEIDRFHAATDGDSIHGADNVGSISRTLQNIINTVNNESALCAAERTVIAESALIGVKEPSTVDGQKFSGGTKDASESNADWSLAIDALRTENVQIIVPITDDTNSAEVAKLLVTHCKHMAGAGQNECNFWYGVPSATASVDAVADAAKAINSRHGALVGQRVKIYNHKAQLVTKDAPYLAVMLAGIQAGTGTAVPMTFKRVDCVDTVTTWSANNNAEKLIRNGVALVTQDTLGFRVERSVTTYLTDDNPVFSEVSANESLNTCIRDLRSYLNVRLGNANVSGTAELVRTIAMTRLRQQVLDGIIKAFDSDALQVADLGDRLRVDARIAVVEPINFIQINAEVFRSITTATA
jgi:hypothetical protein